MLLLRIFEENRVTSQGDRREIQNAQWADSPVTLWSQMKNLDHGEAPIVGSIVAFRRFGNEVYGVAKLSDNADAVQTQKFIEDGSLNGVSADLGYVENILLTYNTNGKITEKGDAVNAAFVQFEDEDGDVFNFDDPVTVIKKPTIAGATLVSIPAFANSKIQWIDSDDIEEVFSHVEVKTADTSFSTSDLYHIAASTADGEDCVDKFDGKYFQKMKFTQFTRMSITDDGHVFGHAYRFGDKHRTLDYTFHRLGNDVIKSDFMQGTAIVKNAKGTERTIKVGNVNYLSPHAPTHEGRLSSAELFKFVQEHSGAKMAAVVAWEDDYGLAVSGQLFSDVKSVDAAKALAGGWSIDIRKNLNSGNFAVYGLHCVNQMGAVAGQIPANVVEYDDGEMVRLVASVGVPESLIPESVSEQFDDIKAALVEFGEDMNSLGRALAALDFFDLTK